MRYFTLILQFVENILSVIVDPLDSSPEIIQKFSAHKLNDHIY